MMREQLVREGREEREIKSGFFASLRVLGVLRGKKILILKFRRET
jgi:hypothetical protein